MSTIPAVDSLTTVILTSLAGTRRSDADGRPCRSVYQRTRRCARLRSFTLRTLRTMAHALQGSESSATTNKPANLFRSPHSPLNNGPVNENRHSLLLRETPDQPHRCSLQDGACSPLEHVILRGTILRATEETIRPDVRHFHRYLSFVADVSGSPIPNDVYAGSSTTLKLACMS